GPASTRYSKSEATPGRVTWNAAEPSPVIGSFRSADPGPSRNTSTADSGSGACGSARSRYADRVTGSPRRTTGSPEVTTTRNGTSCGGRYHGAATRRSRSPEPGTTATNRAARRNAAPADPASHATGRTGA